MPSRNVFLTEHFDSFIASSIEKGHYSNASEVVREGLRLLEQREAEDRAKVEWLRGATQEGIDLWARAFLNTRSISGRATESTLAGMAIGS